MIETVMGELITLFPAYQIVQGPTECITPSINVTQVDYKETRTLAGVVVYQQWYIQLDIVSDDVVGDAALIASGFFNTHPSWTVHKATFFLEHRKASQIWLVCA